MAYIGREPTNSGQFLLIDDISSNFNGSNTSFNLTIGGNAINPAKENILVALDGVLQESDEAYAVTGSQITFTEAPGGTVSFYGVLTGESQFIANESISNDKISPTANISGSKINTDFSAQTVQAKIFSGMVSSSAQLAADISGSLGSNASVIRTLTRDTISGSFSQAHLSSKISGIVSASSIASSAQGEVALTTNGVAASAVDLGLQTSDSVQFSSVQADGGVTVDNITIDGTEIDLSSGDLTVDVAGNIVLDADGAQIRLEDNGTEFGRFSRVSSDLVIKSMGNDNDILFKGVDGSSTITALQLDMSEAGNAIFNNDVTIAGTLTAQEIHTEFTSASIMFSSGSTKFGDTIDDTHEVTGSMTMSGSVNVNDGNLVVLDSLGIGTNSPTFAKLDINAPTATNADNLDQSVDRATLRVRYRTDETDDGMFFGGLGSSHGYIQGVEDASNDNTSQAGKNIIINPYGGNVGVGTQTMDGFFSVNSGTQNAALHVESTDSSANISLADNVGSAAVINIGGRLVFETGGTASTAASSGTESMTISGSLGSAGNVGIGSSSPGSLLTVSGDNKAIDLRSADYSNVLLTSAGSSGAGLDRGLIVIREDGSNKTLLYGDGSATFASDVAIGTTSTDPHSYGGNTLTVASEADANIGNISIASSQNTDDGDALGDLIFTNTGDSSSEKRQVIIRGLIDGGSANARGGRLQISTKQADSTSFTVGMIINNEGTIQNGSTTGFASMFPAANNSNFVSYGFVGDQNTGMFRAAADTLAFGTGGSERMRIASDGLVGIGTSSPGAELDLRHTSEARFRVRSGSTYTELAQNSSGGVISLQAAGGSTGAQITGYSNSFFLGNVGIGTNNPSHLFEVFQDASSYPMLIKQNQGDGLCLDIFASASDQASNDAIIRARTNHATLLQLMNDGRMIVQQSHIQVAGAVIPGTANEADNNKIFTSSSGTGSTNMFLGNAQIQVSSDKRLKINIRDTEMNPIETLNRLRVVDFDWDDPKDTSWNNKMARVKNGGQWSGILAQEAVDVVPHIINAPRIEETLELDHDSENTWQVEYEHLVPTLVKAIQELSKENDEIKKRIEELEK